MFEDYEETSVEDEEAADAATADGRSVELNRIRERETLNPEQMKAANNSQSGKRSRAEDGSAEVSCRVRKEDS